MTWKRSLAIALCSGVLWLYADRTAHADDRPRDGKVPPPHQRPDGPPPGAPHDRPDAGPLDDDFGPPRRMGGEAGRPGPRPGFGPGDQPMQRDGEPRPEGRGGPGMQGPPPDQPGGMPGMLPGGMRGGYGGYGPGYGRGFGYGGMMGRQDPDLFKEAELDRKVQQLVEDYRSEDDKNAKREEMQKEIEKLVGEQFDLRQKRRENELKRMEDQIKRLRETIEKRQKSRTEIIDRHMKELLGQEDEMQF